MKRVYCRCNGGDYFTGTHCPFDGWTSPEVQEVVRAAARLEAEGIPPSIEQLRRAEANDAALRRAVVMEFGTPAAAFEGLTPALYSLGGRGVDL